MTKHDYDVSRSLSSRYPFYALLMACMRRADTGNYELLKQAFPKVAAEVIARYHAPGGVLPEDDVEDPTY